MFAQGVVSADTISYLNVSKMLLNHQIAPDSRILIAFGDQPTFLESTTFLIKLPAQPMILLLLTTANHWAVEDMVTVPHGEATEDEAVDKARNKR